MQNNPNYQKPVYSEIHKKPETDIKLFEIESNVPQPAIRDKKNIEETLRKINFIINNMRPGQSFVSSHLSASTLIYHFKKNFADRIIKVTTVDKNKKWYRVHLIK